MCSRRWTAAAAWTFPTRCACRIADCRWTSRSVSGRCCIPDQPALRFHQKTTTFAELIEQADRLAGALMQRASNRPAGILCERGEPLFIAMLALMHCGRRMSRWIPTFLQPGSQPC